MEKFITYEKNVRLRKTQLVMVLEKIRQNFTVKQIAILMISETGVNMESSQCICMLDFSNYDINIVG